MKLILASADEVARSGRETVLASLPVWARSAVVEALTGIPDGVLRRLVNEGNVRARKMDPASQNSACLFRVGDVLDWIEKEAKPPERFRLPQDSKEPAEVVA